MGWIAINAFELNAHTPVHQHGLLSMSPPENAAEDDIMETGSLFLEADTGRGRWSEQTLFVMHRRGDLTSHISVQLCTDGTIVFARKLGQQHRQVSLNLGVAHPEGIIRVTISWNAPSRWGLLSVELGAEGTLVQKEFTDPLPWLTSDVACLHDPGGDVVFGPTLQTFGLSDSLEPVGIIPSLATGTPVMTPDGYRAVETLRRGDRVLTFDGAIRPVRWVGAREVPARGRFRPIRLHMPYLGLSRDVIAAPEQRITINGPEVEYLFSEEAVLVEAGALINTNFAAYEPAGATTRYHQILLDEHEILQVAGAPMESLFVGNLRERPEMLASTVLSGLPAARLPLHNRLAYPALRDYEAVTLRAALLSR